MTASRLASGTRTTTPTAPRISSAHARSASVACAPGLIAAAPAPISAGVLGIARTTGTGLPSAASMACGRDAGGDGQDPLAAGLRRRRAADSATYCGLTASSAPFVATGAATTVTPGYFAVSSSRRASTTSTTPRSARARGDQPAEQGLAHLPATHDQQLHRRAKPSRARR